MELVKYNNNSISSVTAVGLSSGSLNLITTNTITSGVSSSSFTSNINSTYDTYLFKFINIHPSSDGNRFLFQCSTNGGSSYGVTITSTFFKTFHDEADSSSGLSYDANNDLAQSTDFQQLNLDADLGADNDQSLNGTLHLFSPSNTTFVKHFISCNNGLEGGGYFQNTFVAGYGNTQSAVNAIQFKFDSGNIDSGKIKLYGIKDS